MRSSCASYLIRDGREAAEIVVREVREGEQGQPGVECADDIPDDPRRPGHRLRAGRDGRADLIDPRHAAGRVEIVVRADQCPQLRDLAWRDCDLVQRRNVAHMLRKS